MTGTSTMWPGAQSTKPPIPRGNSSSRQHLARRVEGQGPVATNAGTGRLDSCIGRPVTPCQD